MIERAAIVAGLLPALLAIGCAARHAPQTLPIVAVPPPAVPAPAGPPRTIHDGVYTEAQSRRGEAIYFTTCVPCHKSGMTGSDVVPALVGEPFRYRWTMQTAGDLFEKMRSSMPPTITDRLERQAYADVLAFVFERNGLPPGPDDLAADYAVLRLIRMAPPGP